MTNWDKWLNWIFSIIGGVAGFFFGTWDGLIITLIAFMSLDYITGVINSVVQHSLDSSIGFKGLVKKIYILLLVIVGNLIDIFIIHKIGICRNAVILFFISNEGLSILENAGEMGIPIPEKLKQIIARLNQPPEDGSDDSENVSRETILQAFDIPEDDTCGLLEDGDDYPSDYYEGWD